MALAALGRENQPKEPLFRLIRFFRTANKRNIFRVRTIVVSRRTWVLLPAMSDSPDSTPKKAPIGNQAGPHDYPTNRLPPNAMVADLLPKQIQLCLSKAFQVLYSGAYRAAKTRGLCYWAVQRALEHPSAKVGLVRKCMVDLKNTTLRTLMEPDGDLPPVLPPGTYTYHKVPGEMEIRINGAGRIIPLGCDDPLKLGSVSLSCCGIDEGIELDFAEYSMLLARCSVHYTLENGEPNLNQIVTVTNPGPPSHFLYEQFFDGWKHRPPKKRSPEWELIETNMLENPFLPKRYVDQVIATHHGPSLRRAVYGEWIAFEGAIFPMFDGKTHERHFSGPFEEYIAGVDVGAAHKTAVRVHGIYTDNGEKCSHCVSELYASAMDGPTDEDGVPISLWDKTVKMCKEASRYYAPLTFAVDASAKMLKDHLRKAGLHVKELPTRDVLFGINLVKNALSTKVNDVPKMTFEPGLEGTKEYLSYRWKPKTGAARPDGKFESADKEGPIKQKDDAVDADRYMRVILDSRRSNDMTFFVPGAVNGEEPVVRRRSLFGSREMDFAKQLEEAMWTN